MTHCRGFLLFSLLFCAFWAPGSAFAESIWLPQPTQGDELRLEAVLPNLKDADFTTFSLAWFLSGTFQAKETLAFSVDVPFAHVANPEGSESSSAIGNPYLGLRLGSHDTAVMGELGVRLPFAPDNEEAALFGYLIDQVDRTEAFLPEVASATVGVNYRYRSAEGFGVRLRLAPVLWFDSGTTLADDFEAWIRYSAQGFYQAGPATFGGGITGRYWASSNDSGDNFGQRSIHEFDLFVNLDYGRLRPSLRIRVPLDEDLTEIYEPSAVLSLGVGLP
jgi:hypothetical protein